MSLWARSDCWKAINRSTEPFLRGETQVTSSSLKMKMTFDDQLTEHVNGVLLAPLSPHPTAGPGILLASAKACPNAGGKTSSSPLDGELSTHNQCRGLSSCRTVPAHSQFYFVIKLCSSVPRTEEQVNQPLGFLDF